MLKIKDPNDYGCHFWEDNGIVYVEIESNNFSKTVMHFEIVDGELRYKRYKEEHPLLPHNIIQEAT
jgi:hypothetical protein